MIPETFRRIVLDLAMQAGLFGEPKFHPLKHGANNRTFRVEFEGRSVLLKAYFVHSQDPRDRLGAEFSFMSFAWSQGLRCVPQPIACDHENRIAFYEFIEGRDLQPGQVTVDAVDQALEFWLRLNAHREEAVAGDLPLASEACFSIVDHLAIVDRRTELLGRIGGRSPVYRKAQDFIRRELAPCWKHVRKQVLRCALGEDFDLGAKIGMADRCLSPSDFGFHNAVLGADGRFRFFDFEYAGWDDPARMVCDFFCQIAVPVPMEHFERFVLAVAAELPAPKPYRQRIKLLLPVYRVKWCCILLNEFVPGGKERRRFANEGHNEENELRQLERSRHALARVAPI